MAWEGVPVVVCPSCGTENRPGAKFCSECATPLAAACPECGTSNVPGAKFCSECAAPLRSRPAAGSPAPRAGGAPAGPPAGAVGAASAPVAERRLVSVLFADLVGFTPLAEGRDAEEVRELLTRYFDAAADVVARYGGTVEKFIGDAVMAVWGVPTAHEDDAERAVRAALELVDAVRGLGPGLQARAGVLTGEAAVTIGAAGQGMVAGDLVNTAARLQAAAAPGAVLVDEATWRAASGAIAFEAAGAQALKGKAAPIPAWRALRVVAERRGRGRSGALEAPFTGRDSELRLLKDLFHATARERRTRLVSVSGIGGIGKSRLAWEFEKYLDGILDPVWWHHGRSPAYGEGVTFWALGEMLRGRAGLTETDDEPATRAKVAAMLAQHLPDGSEQRWVQPAILALLGVEAGASSEQLFGAWRTFFERLAETSTVVLVFEDLQWADGGTLDFIDHLLEWCRNVPLLIVTLSRPELLERRPDWGAGKRSFTSIYLEPLPVDAMRELLAGLVPGLPPSARDAIVARADGVPLYAVETVRMLLAQRRLVLEDGAYHPVGNLDDLAVPETLTALISARLDELDAADRALVADAAVLGQSFTLPGLAAVSGLDAAPLEGRLRGLVRRELFSVVSDARSPERGQYAFVQALIREVAYNTLAKRDRKVRHLAAARFFETLETDELAGALAGHYLAAYEYAPDGPEREALAAQARVALRAAADRAAALGSHPQAIAFLERALEVAVTPEDRAELHERALASAMVGIVAEPAYRHAEGALAARRELGNREAILTAITALSQAHTFDTGGNQTLEFLLPAWEEFADLAETLPGAALMGSIAIAHVDRDAYADALGWIDRALPVAEHFGVTPVLARLIAMRSSCLYRTERPNEALILLRGVHTVAVANDFWRVHQNTRTQLTFFEQFADPVAGLAMAREGLEIAARRGSLQYGFFMVGNGVSCAIRTGDWRWARALTDEWLGKEITSSVFLEIFVDRSVLKSLCGEDASDDIASAARLAPDVADPQFASYVAWARAWQAMAAGDWAGACRHGLAAADTTNFFLPIGIPLAARAALWAGELEQARELVDRLADAVWAGQAIDLDRATLRASVAALEGRRADAIAGYREALRGWRQLGLAFDEAMAVVDLATLLAPTEREMAEAPALVTAARATLERLGAAPFLARLDAVEADATAGRR